MNVATSRALFSRADALVTARVVATSRLSFYSPSAHWRVAVGGAVVSLVLLGMLQY